MSSVHIASEASEPEEAVRVPVPRELFRAFRDSMTTGLCALVRDANADGTPSALPLSIGFGNLLLREAIRLFYLDVLTRRTSGAGPVLRGAYADGVRNGDISTASPFIASLRSGPPPRRRIPSLVRYGYTRWIERRTVPETPVTWLDMARDTVATVANPLLSWHARSSGTVAHYVHHSCWFSAVEPGPLERNVRTLRGDVLIREALATVARASSVVGEPLSPFVRAHLEEQILLGTALIQCHLDRLLARRDRLPMQLWVGTGNASWDRMLGAATKAAGGAVTVHDHGPGAGLRASHLKPIFDFYIADTYVTTSAGQAETLKRHPWKEYWLTAEAPQIKVLPPMRDAEVAGRSGSPGLRETGAKPVVMLICQPFYGDDIRYFHPLPDPVAFEWMAELINQLQAWGYQVHLKPHPELPGPADAFGPQVRVLRGLVEDHLEDVDKVLFDWPLTSALKAVTLSRVPGVFIDLGHIEYDQVAWGLMKRRFAVVPADYDGCRSPRIDWTALKESLQGCSSLTDTAFCRYMFG